MKRWMTQTLVTLGGILLGGPMLGGGSPTLHAAGPLHGTQPLDQRGDISLQMVEGIDRFLMGELAQVAERRKARWQLDNDSAAAREQLLTEKRKLFRRIIGVVDDRLPRIEPLYVGGPDTPHLVAETPTYQVFAVRWPVLPGLDAEGLLLEPKKPPIASVIAIPDADQTPEMIVGLAAGVKPEFQFARALVESGCTVLVPMLIDRGNRFCNNPRIGRFTNQPHREFVYRMAYQMGRHLIGYEVQKVLAGVDWLYARHVGKRVPVGLYGYGEGGLLALYAAAADLPLPGLNGQPATRRLTAALVSGYFGPREELWREPIYRNVWDLLPNFGDAEIRELASGTVMVVEYCPVPRVPGPPGPLQGRNDAAPGHLQTPPLEAVQREWKREPLPGGFTGALFVGPTEGPSSTKDLLTALTGKDIPRVEVPIPSDGRKHFSAEDRQKRQFEQLITLIQKLWRDSDDTRRNFWNKADFSTVANFEQSTAWYRNYFWEEVIGKLPEPTIDPKPRSRQVDDTPKWTGYEVMLDVYPEVFAYGVLLVPKDLKPQERRPVVVCQHGLEGRPKDTIEAEPLPVYNRFAAQLADLGYIVYAPQNPYIGQDKFRVLQRKANPLKWSLFSFIVRQHERTLEWLATLPYVDAQKIAFYGLSYGGKTAMRVPAILPKYCLSICSGDFNEWIGKNVSVDFRGSYMYTLEYEMYEFDLGNTFNYAEMAYLIAPRPFMVERGHDDPVGIDEMVAYEYAKVRYLYANRLKIPERTTIEFFPGGHVIHGRGTFDFLQRHLDWPSKTAP